jgi:hypothetical protein
MAGSDKNMNPWPTTRVSRASITPSIEPGILTSVKRPWMSLAQGRRIANALSACSDSRTPNPASMPVRRRHAATALAGSCRSIGDLGVIASESC